MWAFGGCMSRLLLAPLLLSMLCTAPVWAQETESEATTERPQRFWGQIEFGLGAALGEEFPGFGVGSGLAFNGGLRFGLKTAQPLQVGFDVTGIVPENRIFFRDDSGAITRLSSSEVGVDLRVFLRWTSKPGKVRFFIEPGLALPIWEIHRTATSGGVQELGGWFGVWLGGNIGGGVGYHTSKFAVGLRSSISVGGLIGDSNTRFGFGPWLTQTPMFLWWHGPVIFFQFDLKYLPGIRIDFAPVQVVAFVDPTETRGVTVPDRFTHMSFRLTLELPFGPQLPDFDIR